MSNQNNIDIYMDREPSATVEGFFVSYAQDGMPPTC